MFSNSYQSGGHLEIFDAKVNKEKDKTYDKLFKISNIHSVNRAYDKITKGYIYELDGGTQTKIQFPKDDKQELGLIQRYLVFQIFLPVGHPFSLEIVITDTAKNKRRINFSTGVKAIDINYFHVKVPIDSIKRGVWLNLSFDLVSFFELFKGQTFRSIDAFTIGSVCKLRKIFTMKNPLNDYNPEDEFDAQPDAQLVPKTQNFTAGVSYSNQLISLDTVQRHIEEIYPIQDYGTASYDESVTMSGTLGQIMKIKGLSTQTKDMTKQSVASLKSDDPRSNLNSQQKTLMLTGESKPKTRENKENLTALSKGPKRNNLMSTGEHPRTNAHNDEISRAQKIISNNHGNFHDEQEPIRLQVPKPTEKGEISPNRGPVRERSSSKKHKREISTEMEEEKFNEKGNRTSTSKGRNNTIRNSSPEKNSRSGTSAGPSKKLLINQKYNPPGTSQALLNERSPNARKGFPSTPGTISSNSRPQSNNNNPWNNNELVIKANKFLKQSGRYDSPPHTTENDQTSMHTKKTVSEKPPSEKKSLSKTPNKYSTPDKSSKVSSAHNSATKGKSSNMTLKKNASAGGEYQPHTHFEDIDRFSTLSKSPERPKQRRDIGDDLEDIGEWEKDEIESIQEDLEFDGLSNASGLQGHAEDKKVTQKPISQFRSEISAKTNTTNQTAASTNVSTKKSVSEVHQLLEKTNNPKYKLQGLAMMEATIDDFNDSLESNGNEVKSTSTMREKVQIEKEINNLEGQMNTMVSKVRPFSPPFTSSMSIDTKSLIFAKGGPGENMIEVKKGGKSDDKRPPILETKQEDGEEMMEVVYDPVWNCYYHPKTNQYFELKS